MLVYRRLTIYIAWLRMNMWSFSDVMATFMAKRTSNKPSSMCIDGFDFLQARNIGAQLVSAKLQIIYCTQMRVPMVLVYETYITGP